MRLFRRRAVFTDLSRDRLGAQEREAESVLYPSVSRQVLAGLSGLSVSHCKRAGQTLQADCKDTKSAHAGQTAGRTTRTTGGSDGNAR